MPAYSKTTIAISTLPDFAKMPKGVPWAFDGMTLAHHLGVRHRTIMAAIMRRHKEYSKFFIQKKSGNARTIHAPSPRLKFLQKRLLQRFFTDIAYPAHIGAYVPERSPRYSAEQHCNKKILIIIDLKDFFPSTRRAWVRKMLQSEFHMNFVVASLIADLATVPVETLKGRRYIVPQGAPTSGAICNWVAYHRFDKELLELCQQEGFAYTRYADDLAFSTDKNLTRWQTNKFINKVYKLIQQAGYIVNRKKSRVLRPTRQQRLLGMTVNEKPNVMRHSYRSLRARIHHCKYKGYDAVAKEMSVKSGALLKTQIVGLVSHFNMINPEKAALLKQQLQDVDDYHAQVLHAVPRDPVDTRETG